MNARKVAAILGGGGLVALLGTGTWFAVLLWQRSVPTPRYMYAPPCHD